jgi:hypothetical protein
MNKEFENRKKIALSILARKGISKRNYSPPFYIFLWNIGINIRPPHFMRFTNLLFFSGLPFGFCWLGIAMMDRHWFLDNIYFVGLIFIVINSLSGGLIAIYYKISSSTNKVPKWEDLEI